MPLNRLAVIGVAATVSFTAWTAPAQAQEPSAEDFADLLAVIMAADEVSFGSAEYDAASATATLVDVELVSSQPDYPDVAFGEVVMTGTNWAAIEAMLDPPADIEVGAEPVLLMNSMAMTDIVLAGPDLEVAVASSTVDGVHGRPFRLEVDPDTGEWSDQSAADAATAFAIDRSEMLGLRATEPGTDNTFSIGSLVVEGMGPGRIDTLRLQDMSVVDTGPDQIEVSVALMQLLGLDASALISAVARGEDPDMLMQQDAITYGPRVSEMLVEQVAGTGLDGTEQFRLGRFLTTVDGSLGADSLSMSITLDDLTAALDESDGELFDMGYETLSVNGSVIGEWLASSTEMDLSINLTAADIGQLQFTGTIGGISADMPPPPAAFGIVKIIGATLRFDDASLVERAIAAYAEDADLGPEEAREQIIADMAAQRETAPSPALADMVDAAMAFVTDPQNLTLTIDPPTPVGPFEVMGLSQMGPGAVADALQPGMVANQ